MYTEQNSEKNMTIKIQIPKIEDYPDLSVYDFITHTFVPNKLQAFDKELFGIKWWDYRFMSPCEATMNYIDTFGQESRKIYSRDIDSVVAQHIGVMNKEKMLAGLMKNEEKSKRLFSGFWRGRQVADAIGMPYSIYIYEALSQRMRRWQRAYLPSASQVYQEGDVERVAARWEELKASRVYYADHHLYLSQNYQGSSVQKAYSEYLVDRSHGNIETLADMVEADRLSLDYLSTEQVGLYEQVNAFLK
jgi:hypothetical protein